MRIRTVLNDLVPDALGVCDSHDHLFFRSAVLPGQELDDEAAAVAEVRAFADAGGQAIVQWTPHGLNRRADLLPRISTSTGVSIVAATGLHRREHYPDGYVDKVQGELAEIFVRELTLGVAETQIRAGLVKVAGGFHILDAHAELVMRASAVTRRRPELARPPAKVRGCRTCSPTSGRGSRGTSEPMSRTRRSGATRRAPSPRIGAPDGTFPA